MQPPNRAPGSSDNTVWIVLAIVGSVLITCVGLPVCLGVASFIWIGRSAQQAFSKIEAQIAADMDAKIGMRVTESLLADLHDGDVEAAYEKTTEEYQRRYSLEEFRRFVEKHRLLKDRSLELESGPQSPASVGNRRAFRLVRESVNGATTPVGRIVVIEENGIWKIDEIVID